ncbi:MAG: Ty1/Copia family ribonuclease HI, partial [Spirosomaceae bacterium]|nr:Ty1/Copia family ribonuclease HI [Spirosomataceae bacterium]
DIQPAIAFFSTRVQHSNEDDWKKLRRLIKFLNGTKDDLLTLEADDTHIVKWHIDAAFAVHDDFRSHTGATLSLGSGAVMSASTKQKVNTRSSTEAELIGLDDYIAQVVWTKNFLEAQGYGVKDTVIYQDNMSTIKLAENGRASAGKRSRHLNIKYFFITDLIRNKQVSIKYCPTDEMLADYMSKPLTGRKFHRDRRLLMNLPNTDSALSTGVCRIKDRPSKNQRSSSVYEDGSGSGNNNMVTINLFATGTTSLPT